MSTSHGPLFTPKSYLDVPSASLSSSWPESNPFSPNYAYDQVMLQQQQQPRGVFWKQHRSILKPIAVVLIIALFLGFFYYHFYYKNRTVNVNQEQSKETSLVADQQQPISLPVTESPQNVTTVHETHHPYPLSPIPEEVSAGFVSDEKKYSTAANTKEEKPFDDWEAKEQIKVIRQIIQKLYAQNQSQEKQLQEINQMQKRLSRNRRFRSTSFKDNHHHSE